MLFGFGKPNIEKMKDKKDTNGLIKALSYKKHLYIPMHAARALGEMGEPAVKPLIKTLKDEDSTVRMGAIESLGRISDVHAVEPLKEALKDKNLDVRKAAAEVLEKMNDDRSISAYKH